MEGNPPRKKGVGLKAFGSVLFFLGILNMMFSLKAGLKPPGFYTFMIIAGIIIVFIGYLRGTNKI